MEYKKLNAVFGTALLVLCFSCAHTSVAASLTITEIMYDPAGTDSNREWIEIYNGTSSAVDLSTLFFLTDGLASSHHALVPQGSGGLAAASYAVIVQNVDSFKTDYPAYTGMIVDSSWSGLTATSGKTLAIIDAENAVLDQTTYDPQIGATNDGNSLQKDGTGVWVSAAPTPGSASLGVVADTTSTTTQTTQNNAGGGGAVPASPPPPKVVLPTRIQSKIALSETAIVGIPITITPTVVGLSNEQRFYGAFHIAFGDGTARDAKMQEKFEHIYTRAGAYVVSFEYRTNVYQRDPDTTVRATVTASLPPVVISAVESDGSIEISNQSEADTDISGWIIRSGGDDTSSFRFVIPQGTIILPKMKIIFSAEVLGLSGKGTGMFELALPSTVRVMSYGEEEGVPVSSVVSAAEYSQPVTRQTAAAIEVQSVTEVPLSGSVIGTVRSETGTSSETRSKSLLPYIAGLAAVIGGAFIALRRSDILSQQKLPMRSENSAAAETQAIADEIRIIE